MSAKDNIAHTSSKATEPSSRPDHGRYANRIWDFNNGSLIVHSDTGVTCERAWYVEVAIYLYREGYIVNQFNMTHYYNDNTYPVFEDVDIQDLINEGK